MEEKSTEVCQAEVATPDVTNLRSREVIETEYKAVAAQLGDKVYRNAVMTQEISQIQQTMFKLNQEAAKIAPAPVPGDVL